MPMISHFAAYTIVFVVVHFLKLSPFRALEKKAKYEEGKKVDERLKKRTRGQRELRHISPVLIRNVTKWWILRSRALQQEMNSDLRAVDLGAPTASWEII